MFSYLLSGCSTPTISLDLYLYLAMDAYKKLSEVGACLYQAGRHDQCIKVLNAAQKVATNQRGITMKVQLTLANAHSALKHTEIAISLYQVSYTEGSLLLIGILYVVQG